MSVIAVVGVGAVRGAVAAPLCAAGRDDVVLCVREPFDELVVESPADAGTSMLTDRRQGRRLEADARNGAVPRIGARHGIEAPLNRALTALLNAIHQDV